MDFWSLLIAQVLEQAHLGPLPPLVRPVYWNYDHALRLYPLPGSYWCRLLLPASTDFLSLTFFYRLMLCQTHLCWLTALSSTSTTARAQCSTPHRLRQVYHLQRKNDGASLTALRYCRLDLHFCRLLVRFLVSGLLSVQALGSFAVGCRCHGH